MSNLDAFIERLSAIEWFNEIGNACNEDLGMSHKCASSWSSALNRRGRESSDVFLEGANLYTRDLGINYCLEYRKWNDYVYEVDTALSETIFPKVFSLIDDRSKEIGTEEWIEYLKQSIDWDLVHIGMEYVYSDLVKPKFYGVLANVYEAGHFPCDWDEVWPNGTIWIY